MNPYGKLQRMGIVKKRKVDDLGIKLAIFGYKAVAETGKRRESS